MSDEVIERSERKLFRRQRLAEAGDVRATVFNIVRAADSTSRQVAFSDEFLSLATHAGATIVLPTPYNVPRLYQFLEESNILRPCIDAFVTNTVRNGWEVAESARGLLMNDGERVELESFIENANSDESLPDVMEKVVFDREVAGFGFLEVVRDAARRPSIWRHCPSLYTRLCAKDQTDILVQYEVRRGRRVSMVTEYRKFRRLVQIVNGKHVWFREFGDPRRMSFHNGAFEGQSGFDPSKLATELIHFKNPSAEVYGLPRWINQLPSILGSREAEEVNMRYFRNNTVPPLMVLVGGGRLTASSFKTLQNALKNEAGEDRQHQMLLLEATGDADGVGDKANPIDLKVEKLADSRQSDGLFKAYDDANMAKVRSSFRLPPITVGMSQDVNFATASTSAFVAESQVFAPERDKQDGILNKLLINGKNGLNLQTVKLVSRTPSITSPEMLIKTLTALNVIGAVTPREAQKIANKTLQTELTPYPEKGEEGYEDWMDKPMPLFISEQQAKEKEAARKSQEQQALKDQETKDAEATGEVGPKNPKNGEQ
jgi:PBSX family phage portal protein